MQDSLSQVKRKSQTDIDGRFKQLRAQTRRNQKFIIKNFSDRYLGPIDLVPSECCAFCGKTQNLTREHVLPKWVFESNSSFFYVNQWNLQKRRYIDATIPTCETCNNELLAGIERHIQRMFSTKKVGTKSYAFPREYEYVIRWFEIINYKFKVHDLTQKFLAHKKAGFLPGLSELSLATMMNGFPSWFKVQVELRHSLKRISIKDKSDRIRSLVFGKTKENKGHHFFNSDNFIFLEMPQFGMALFYFYKKNFRSERSAHKAMYEVLRHAYSKEQNQFSPTLGA